MVLVVTALVVVELAVPEVGMILMEFWDGVTYLDRTRTLSGGWCQYKQ